MYNEEFGNTENGFSMVDSIPLSPNDQTSQLLAWWKLLRAGNVYTAASNVIAGFLVVQGEWQPVGPLLLLVLSSMLLYEAGMVLNDAFDAELDSVERPERPIPSGQISQGKAFFVGWSLLAVGVICTWLTSWLIGEAAPAVVGSSLAIVIVLYNAGLKSTWAGPLAMGWCRLLNVLIGASINSENWELKGIWYVAIGVGIYTVGLTLLARRETGNAQFPNKRPIPLIIIAGLLIITGMPLSFTYGINRVSWYIAWGALFSVIVAAMSRIEKDLSPALVRSVVKKLIMGFIVIDAVIAAGAAGWMSGLIVLCLLIPTLIASHWAPMT